jgi:ionotropic glutamate receptor
VNGNGIREIGFWTPRGLVNTLDITTNESTYRTSNSNPLTIIWPMKAVEDRGANEGWILLSNIYVVLFIKGRIVFSV